MTHSASASNHVIMYHKPTCPFCKMAHHLLNKHGITDAQIKMINILEIEGAKEEMHDKYGKTVPQIIINKHHVGGCDDLMDLIEEDKLEDILVPKAPNP